MIKKKILLGSLFVGGVLALIRLAFIKVEPAKPKQKPATYHEIEAFIEEQRRRFNIPGGALAIVEGKKIVHVCGFGKARPNGEMPTAHTPFFIGSLTKSFTALAIMQLVEAGKIELDAPVQRYLPWFRLADPEASASLTIHHLLNHTSGLPMSVGMANLGNLDDGAEALERQVRSLAVLKLNRPVGSRFEYSNTNYNILGLIIEVVSGETYQDYINKNVFKPLEMNHSFCSKEVAKSNGLAVGHRFWFGIPIPAPDLPIPRNSLPSGQLISSVEDMAHYLIANLNDGCYHNAQVLSPAGIKAMHNGTAEIIEMGMSLGAYGMGWIEEKKEESRIVSHSGIVPDFSGFMALIPEKKRGIIILFNANHAMMKLTLDEVGMGAAQRLAGEQPSPMKLGGVPWVMRAMLLIPILQIVGVVATLGKLSLWRKWPQKQPNQKGMWKRYILFPLIPNLLISLTTIPMFGKMWGFIKLFMPDFSWIARICGVFAGLWSVIRTCLMLSMRRKDS